MLDRDGFPIRLPTMTARLRVVYPPTFQSCTMLGTSSLAEALSLLLYSSIVAAVAGRQHLRHILNGKHLWIELFNNTHVLHEKVRIRVVFESRVPIRI